MHDFLSTAFPDLTFDQKTKLEKYCRRLIHYNQRHNLISRTDIDNIVVNHILPSLIVLKMTKIPFNCRVIDVGAGGGLPGIPIKIVRPDIKLVLAESIRKKSLFLKKIVQDLELDDTWVWNRRIERNKEYKHKGFRFNVALFRAVTTVETILSIGLNLLCDTGFILAWKGEGDISKLTILSDFENIQNEILNVSSQFFQYSKKFEPMRVIKISKIIPQ